MTPLWYLENVVEKPVDNVVELPIDGILDLHPFAPGDAASVVQEYIRACLERGILDIRIIHGKGKGVLRRTVHAVLEKDPRVEEYGLSADASGWGATWATLTREEGPPPQGSEDLPEKR